MFSKQVYSWRLIPLCFRFFVAELLFPSPRASSVLHSNFPNMGPLRWSFQVPPERSRNVWNVCVCWALFIPPGAGWQGMYKVSKQADLHVIFQALWNDKIYIKSLPYRPASIRPEYLAFEFGNNSRVGCDACATSGERGPLKSAPVPTVNTRNPDESNKIEAGRLRCSAATPAPYFRKWQFGGITWKPFAWMELFSIENNSASTQMIRVSEQSGLSASSTSLSYRLSNRCCN